jgi:hypothetical protein
VPGVIVNAGTSVNVNLSTVVGQASIFVSGDSGAGNVVVTVAGTAGIPTPGIDLLTPVSLSAVQTTASIVTPEITADATVNLVTVQAFVGFIDVAVLARAFTIKICIPSSYVLSLSLNASYKPIMKIPSSHVASLPVSASHEAIMRIPASVKTQISV